MGCISSKVISRSISYRDELSQRQQIFGSRKGSDQFLALICSSDKLRNGSTNLGSSSNRESIKEIDANGKDSIGEEIVLSMLPRLSLKDLELGRVDPPKRSKSWHQFPEDELSSSPTRQSSDNDKFDWRSIAVNPRSRSFHTVEEFDALLERIRHTSVLYEEGDDDKSFLKGTYQTATSDEALVKDVTLNEAEHEEVSRSISVEPSTTENTAQENHLAKNGPKRRSLARGLESLKIPAAIEFPAVGSLREWLQVGGQVDSPATYVTPKFGSYPISNSKSENHSSSKGCVFNPELVTAIEEHMQQLQVEEDTLLKQITGTWEDHGAEVDQVKEELEPEIEKGVE